MNFDKMKLTDKRAKKWLNEQLKFIKEIIEEDIENGDKPQYKLKDVKPGMPFNVDPKQEDFNTYYVFKDIARNYDLMCFRHYAYEDLHDVKNRPKTLKGHAALIEWLLQKYDERLQKIADSEPMDAVRRAWMFMEPRVVETLEDNGEDSWKWVVNAIQPDTHFDRVGKTGGSPEIQQQIDNELEDGSIKDALMNMHGPKDNTMEVKRNIMEVLEKSSNTELVPGLAKAMAHMKTGKKWWDLDDKRNDKLEAMQTFGDMMVAFEKMRK